MKKITILAAALLGSVYFANAQVGIGTPTPNASAMLDITATNKGVLIPRVALTHASNPLEGATTHENSLLVYNTATAREGFEGEEVKPGFYYWNVNKWERIVNQSQLDAAITNVTNLQGDVTKIKALLDAAYGSNNLGETATNGAFGGMVFTPADGNTPAKVEYVVWNGTGYVKQDVTSALSNLINQTGNVIFNSTTQSFQYYNGTDYVDLPSTFLQNIVKTYETDTKIQTIQGKQFYFAENFVGDIPTNIPDELPAGMYLIDVVGGVVNNFEEILNSNVVIEGEQYTIEEYIEYISQNADLKDGVMTFVPGTGDTLAEQLASSSFTYNVTDAQGNTTTQVVNFGSLVKANQSLTNIATTNPSANVINYVYTAEPDLDGTARTFTIDLTQDLIDQITNNQNVQNAITNLTLGNGSVFYNGSGGDITVGGEIIPADTFYLINENGEGEAIDLGNIVVNEVVENFNTIVDSSVTVDGTTYTTVEQYIQQVASNNGANVGYTTVAIPASGTVGQPGYQAAIPANSFYTVDPTTGVKTAINLGTLVQEHETDTSFERKTGTGAYQAAETTEPSAEAGKVVYKYNAEGTTQYLDITADVLESVNNNTSVKNAIKNILNTGGAVYYGDHDSNASTPDVLYHIVGTTNEPIVVPIDIQQLITTISNASQDNKNIIKTQLGDVLIANTSVITGDTYKGKAVRKGIFSTTITANTATTTGVTLDVDASEIISITVKYNGGLVANVTDLTVSGTAVGFNIGTGNMYQVLGDTNIVAEVIIEFTTNE